MATYHHAVCKNRYGLKQLQFIYEQIQIDGHVLRLQKNF